MKPTLFALTLTLIAGAALAEPLALDSRIDGLAREWAHANYETHDRNARATESARIAGEAASLARQYPNRAEPLVWEAIAIATEAGAKGGVSALGLAKSARDLLQEAERINPAALGDGSIYSSLGSLYTQVPSFPIGFGDSNKARAYLRKALAANPNGIDPNYFYGDLLSRQGDHSGAIRALERAIAAPPRPGREVADHGRRAEAQALLAQERQKLRG